MSSPIFPTPETNASPSKQIDYLKCLRDDVVNALVEEGEAVDGLVGLVDTLSAGLEWVQTNLLTEEELGMTEPSQHLTRITKEFDLWALLGSVSDIKTIDWAQSVTKEKVRNCQSLVANIGTQPQAPPSATSDNSGSSDGGSEDERDDSDVEQGQGAQTGQNGGQQGSTAAGNGGTPFTSSQKQNLWIPRATDRLWGHGGVYRGVVKDKDTAKDEPRPNYPNGANPEQFGQGHLPVTTADVSLGTWLPTRVSALVHGLHGKIKSFWHGDEAQGIFAIAISGDTITTWHIKDHGDTIKFSDAGGGKDRSRATKRKGRKTSKATKKKPAPATESEDEGGAQDTSTRKTTNILSGAKIATPDGKTGKVKSSAPQSGDKRGRRTADLSDNDQLSDGGEGDRAVSAGEFKHMKSISKCFQKSYENKKEIRVMRGGPKRESAPFPITYERGFRYDGLYVVVSRTAKDNGKGGKSYVWTLQRESNQAKSLDQIQRSSPTQSQLDDLTACEKQVEAMTRNGWPPSAP
ncbi:hypothetical protein CB0940_06007 [Cercospora beticola]|uniref:YDG domain-containing protein n=1 Tax=Cercospora beticola TaxID=122368 RepID=A0A2G5HXU0_CERBT|nr:hypothetical protein CB0940_06007 [Cercospora beticola]PIA97336.1 hypothetical protein CB0940_06007 [Cercospora beticola]WPA98616.1 hypothetical protein RHO25_003229 [Cercospora beticola]